MKKKLMALTFISALAIMFMPAYVNAASVDMAYEVYHNRDVSTYSISKTVEGTQSIKFTEAYTALTNPCPKCQVTFKPYRDGYGGAEGFTAQMNQTKSFGYSTTKYTGKYHLTLRRFDLTALPTMALFKWIYQ